MSCQKLDEQVVHPDKALEQVMNQFICVRIVNIDDIDFNMFQFDTELSFAAFFLNSQGDIYGRYGTRSFKDRKIFASPLSYNSLGVDNTQDVTVEGFKKAAIASLSLHEKYKEDKSIQQLLQGKRKISKWKTPRSIPAMPKRGCIHCHHITTYSIVSRKKAKLPVLDKNLWAFPMPDVLGFTLDPKEKAKIKKVTARSEADTAGLKIGDEIQTMNKQPIVSIADVQWVLNETVAPNNITMEVLRQGQVIKKILVLPSGWRRRSGFNWRWRSCRELWLQYTNYAFDLEDVTFNNFPAAKVSKVDFPNVQAQQKIFANDLIIDVDHKGPKTASGLLAYVLQEKKIGEKLHLVIVRDNQQISVSIETTTR